MFWNFQTWIERIFGVSWSPYPYLTVPPMPCIIVSIYMSWKVWFAPTLVLLGKTKNKGTPVAAAISFIPFFPFFPFFSLYSFGIFSCFWLSGILALCSWRFQLILLRLHMLRGHAMQASCFVAEGYMMQLHVVC